MPGGLRGDRLGRRELRERREQGLDLRGVRRIVEARREDPAAALLDEVDRLRLAGGEHLHARHLRGVEAGQQRLLLHRALLHHARFEPLPKQLEIFDREAVAGQVQLDVQREAGQHLRPPFR